MTRIIKIVIANGLPSAEGKSEVLIQPLITVVRLTGEGSRKE